MLKKFLIASATGALMASTALAQTTPTPQASETPAATPPAASVPAASTPAPTAATPAPAASSTTASASASAKFVTTQTSEQWLGTKFKGTDVIGSDDKKIGDVGDVVFDKSGKVVAVVVGVGGFLGIGQKDVALDMAAFQVVPASAGTSGTATTASASDPNDVKLKLSMTKEELTNAPAFEYYKAAPRTAGSTTGAGGTTGSAPRPATPTR